MGNRARDTDLEYYIGSMVTFTLDLRAETGGVLSVSVDGSASIQMGSNLLAKIPNDSTVGFVPAASLRNSEIEMVGNVRQMPGS